MEDVRIYGAGFYGCHIAKALREKRCNVNVFESTRSIFSGASGNIPARVHQGFHYPRSRMTRAACLEHEKEFMNIYGGFTRGVPINIYAIAKNESLVDFSQYKQTLSGEVPFIEIYKPEEFGLFEVEGALLTGERHIVTDRVAKYFKEEIGDLITYEFKKGKRDFLKPSWAKPWEIDCTFCSNENSGVDRYEPCIVPLLEGPSDKAVTIMDGPFGSLYPWDEDRNICSLSSAKYTPFTKDCKTYNEATEILLDLSMDEIFERTNAMIQSMEKFYPQILDFKVVDHRFSVRAMPLSGADTRLVDVQRDKKVIKIRAGKIDAIIHAQKEVERIMGI